MREMVLNHASLVPPDEHTCLCWLRDLAVGMSILTMHRVVDSALRSLVPAGGGSLVLTRLLFTQCDVFSHSDCER